MMRYQVKPVANANGDSLMTDVIAEFEKLDECHVWLKGSPSHDGWNVSETYNLRFGYGIEDTQTGLMDFGKG